MASSSERGAYVRFSQARFNGDEPLSSYSRDIVGNVNHIADQFSQVRVAWVARNASHYFEPEVGGTPLVNTLYRLWQSLPFDLHVRETGESYGLRCRVRGARSAGSGTVSFRIVIASESHGAAYVNNADLLNPNVVQGASTSSATHAWLSLVPPLANLNADQVQQATRVPSTVDEIGGSVVAGSWLRCTAEVWAKTTDAASVPRLSGVQIAEYYGP